MMGIKRRQFIYVSDRNQEFEIDEMQSSHLLNAINHHNIQADTIRDALTHAEDPDDLFRLEDDQVRNLNDRLNNLEETTYMLLIELADRTLEDDAKRDDGGYTRGNDHY